jgi:hypothetical protein
MNRPSRTDDDFDHPTWNQNPPFLAADLTTRQDLNGIANAREHRNRDAGPANGFGFLDDEKIAAAADSRVSDSRDMTRQHRPTAMSGRFTRKSRLTSPIPSMRPYSL